MSDFLSSAKPMGGLSDVGAADPVNSGIREYGEKYRGVREEIARVAPELTQITNDQWDQVKQILDVSDDPSEAIYQFAEAFEYARRFEQPLDSVINNVEAYRQAWLGRDVGSYRDGWTAYKDSVRIGELSSQINDLMREWRDVDQGADGSEALKKANDLERQQALLEDRVPRHWFIEGLKIAGPSIAFTAKTAGVGVGVELGIKAVGALGGPAGIAVATPIAKIAGFLATWATSSTGMDGLLYKQMREAGADHLASAGRSKMGGMVAGFFEGAFGLVPGAVDKLGGRAALKALAGTFAKHLGAKGIYGLALAGVVGYLKEAGEEGVEEFAQGITDTAFTNAALRESNARYVEARGKLLQAEDEFKRLARGDIEEALSKAGYSYGDEKDLWEGRLEEAWNGFVSALYLGAPTAVYGNVAENLSRSKALRDAAGKSTNLDQFQKRVAALKPTVTSPEEWTAKTARIYAATKEQLAAEADITAAAEGEEKVELAPGEGRQPITVREDVLEATDSEITMSYTAGDTKTGQPTAGVTLVEDASTGDIEITDVVGVKKAADQRVELLVDVATRYAGRKIAWTPRGKAGRAVLAKATEIINPGHPELGLSMPKGEIQGAPAAKVVKWRMDAAKAYPKANGAVLDVMVAQLQAVGDQLVRRGDYADLDAFMDANFAEKAFTSDIGEAVAFAPESKRAELQARAETGAIWGAALYDGAKNMVFAARGGDPYNLVHEVGHTFFQIALKHGLNADALSAWAGKDIKTWTDDEYSSFNERFAEGLQGYVATGETTNPQNATLMRRAADLLHRIVERLKAVFKKADAEAVYFFDQFFEGAGYGEGMAEPAGVAFEEMSADAAQDYFPIQAPSDWVENGGMEAARAAAEQAILAKGLAPDVAREGSGYMVEAMQKLGPWAQQGFVEEGGEVRLDNNRLARGLVAYEGVERRTTDGRYLRGSDGNRIAGPMTRKVAQALGSMRLRGDDQFSSVEEALAWAENVTYLQPQLYGKKKELRYAQDKASGFYGNDKMAFSNLQYPKGRNTYDIAGCGREAWAVENGQVQKCACYSRVLGNIVSDQGAACYAEVIVRSKQGAAASVAGNTRVLPVIGDARKQVEEYYAEHGLEETQRNFTAYQVKEYPQRDGSVKLSVGRVTKATPSAVVSDVLQPAKGQDIRLGVDTDGAAWLSNPKVMDALLASGLRTLTVYSSGYHAPPAPHPLSRRTIIDVTISGWHPIGETLSRIRWAEIARANGWNVILREVVANPDQFGSDTAEVYNRVHAAIMATDFYVMQQPLHIGQLHGRTMYGMPSCCVGSAKNSHTCDQCEVAEGLGLRFQAYYGIIDEKGEVESETILPDVADYHGWKGAPDTRLKSRENAPAKETVAYESAIETPAFKNWFRNSKVVDKDGNPLVVYHDTKAKGIQVFRRGDMGIHFGTETQASDIDMYFEEGDERVTHKAYLSIQNPLRLQDPMTWSYEFLEGQLESLGIITWDDPEIKALWDRSNDRSVGEDENGKAYDALTELLIERIKAKGYDGIVYVNRSEGLDPSTADETDLANSTDEEYRTIRGAEDSWMAFDSEQVKSVENVGSWDPSNPNIYYELIGTKADLSAIEQQGLVEAQAMEERGDRAEDIRLATGWFRGPVDNAWRYEIPDDFTVDEKAFKKRKDGTRVAKGQLLDLIAWPSLQERYARRVLNIPAVLTLAPTAGVETHMGKIVRGDYGVLVLQARGRDIEEIKDILVHEVQHVIQIEEGWAGGGNVDEALPDYTSEDAQYQARELAKYLGSLGPDPAAVIESDSEVRERVLEMKAVLEDAATFAGYKAIPGEVEANQSAFRRNLTPGQRRIYPPGQPIADDIRQGRLPFGAAYEIVNPYEEGDKSFQVGSSKPSQPSNDLDEIYRLVGESMDEFSAFTDRIAAKYGDRVRVVKRPSLKNKARAERKITAEDPASSILDINGHTIVARSLRDVYNVVADLTADPAVTRLKDRWYKAMPGGYRDMLSNVVLGNGSVVELQVTTEAMFEAKEGSGGHWFYEIADEVQKAQAGDVIDAAEARALMERVTSFQEFLYWEAFGTSVADSLARTSAFDIGVQLEAISEYFQESGAWTRVLSDKTRNAIAELKARILSSQSTNLIPGSSNEGVNGMVASTPSIMRSDRTVNPWVAYEETDAFKRWSAGHRVVEDSRLAGSSVEDWFNENLDSHFHNAYLQANQGQTAATVEERYAKMVTLLEKIGQTARAYVGADKYPHRAAILEAVKKAIDLRPKGWERQYSLLREFYGMSEGRKLMDAFVAALPEGMAPSAISDKDTVIEVAAAIDDKYSAQVGAQYSGYALVNQAPTVFAADLARDVYEKFGLPPDNGAVFTTGEPIVAKVYHGTPRDPRLIEAFESRLLGNNTKANSARIGWFAAGSTDTAYAYTQGSTAPSTLGYERLKIAAGLGDAVAKSKLDRFDQAYNDIQLEGAKAAAEAKDRRDDIRNRAIKNVANTLRDLVSDGVIRLDRRNLSWFIEAGGEVIYIVRPQNMTMIGPDVTVDDVAMEIVDNIFWAESKPALVAEATSILGFMDLHPDKSLAQPVQEMIDAQQAIVWNAELETQLAMFEPAFQAQIAERAGLEDFDPTPTSGDGGVIALWMKFDNPKVVDWGGGAWAKRKGDLGWSQTIKLARDEGYDGIILQNARDGGPEDNIFVKFGDSGIKDASGRNVTFDDTNRIYYEEDSLGPVSAHYEPRELSDLMADASAYDDFDTFVSAVKAFPRASEGALPGSDEMTEAGERAYLKRIWKAARASGRGLAPDAPDDLGVEPPYVADEEFMAWIKDGHLDEFLALWAKNHKMGDQMTRLDAMADRVARGIALTERQADTATKAIAQDLRRVRLEAATFMGDPAMRVQAEAELAGLAPGTGLIRRIGEPAVAPTLANLRKAAEEGIEDPDLRARVIEGRRTLDEAQASLDTAKADISRLRQSISAIEAEEKAWRAAFTIPERDLADRMIRQRQLRRDVKKIRARKVKPGEEWYQRQEIAEAEAKFLGISHEIRELQKAIPKESAVARIQREAREEGRSEEAERAKGVLARTTSRYQEYLAKRDALEAEMRRKVKEREAYRRERAVKMKLAKQIMRKAGPSIHVDYQEAIERIQAALDPAFRAAATVESRKKTLDYFKDHPDILEDVGSDFVEKLARKSLGEWTLSDLRDLAAQVQMLRKLGRLKRGLFLARRKRRREAWKHEIRMMMTGTDAPPPFAGEAPSAGPVKAGLYATLRGAEVVEMFGGGVLKTLLVDRVNKATDESSRRILEREAAMAETVKRLGLSPTVIHGPGKTALHEHVDIGGWKGHNGWTPTWEDVAYWSVGILNPETAKALEHGNGIPLKVLREGVAMMPPQVREFAEAIRQDLESRAPALRSMVRHLTNVDLQLVSMYLPMRRLEVSYDTRGEEVLADLAARSGQVKAFLKKGMLKSRLEEIADLYQTPIRTDIYGVWKDAVVKEEMYLSFEELIGDLNAVFGDTTVQRAIAARNGHEANAWIRKYIADIAAPDLHRRQQGTSRLISNAPGVIARSALSYNVLSYMKQAATSWLPFLGDAGPVHLLGSIFEFVGNPAKFLRDVEGMSAQVLERKSRGAWDILATNEKTDIGKAIKEIGQAGMVPFKIIDYVEIAWGWKAVYNARKAKGATEEEARREADASIARTQPVSRVQDLPQIYRSGSDLQNMALMFTNALSAFYGMVATAPRAIRDGKVWRVVGDAAAIAATGMILAAMTGRLDGDDDEERRRRLLMSMATQVTDSIPFVGSAITSLAMPEMSGARGGMNIFPTFEDLGYVKRELSEGDLGAATLSAAVAALRASGLPAVQIRRILRAMQSGEWPDAFGIKGGGK